MPSFEKLIPPTVLAFVAAALVWILPDSIHWRDSGEFHLTAHYLDIAHPAGFPIYAQLSNLFSLLPLGPIVWRTHLFSLTVIILWLWVLGLTAKEVCQSNYCWLAPFFAAFTLPTVKSALSAEVYGLHALLLTLITLLVLRFRSQSDYRFLALASVVAALALGNHVASIVFLAPFFIVWGSQGIAKQSLLLSTFVAIFVTVGIYAFLPARSASSLALNTGDPSSYPRLVDQLSNARNSALRTATPSTEGSVIYVVSDSLRLAKECGAIPALFGLIGLYLLLFKDLRSATTFVILIFSTLIFFAGWDPDPWLPAIGALAITASFAIGKVCERAAAGTSRLIIIALIAIHPLTQAGLSAALSIKHDRSAELTGRQLLDAVATNGTVVVEPSWFLIRAITLLEGVRDDVTVIYTPSLLFPRYFAPSRYTINEDKKSSLDIGSEADFEPRAAALKNIGRILGPLCQASPCLIEPSLHLSHTLQQVLTLGDDGWTRLIFGSSGVDTNYTNALLKRLSQIHTMGCLNCGTLATDRINYIESVANSQAQLLEGVGRKEEALQILHYLCQMLDCSETTRLNIAQLERALILDR